MRRSIPLIGLAVLAALTSGCVGLPAEGLGPTPLTPTSRFALQVEPGVERIALAVHETGVSANQTEALSDLATRFAAERAPVLRVEAPSGGDPVSSDMAWRVRGALEAQGIPAHLLQVATYVAPDPRAPILVGFDTVRATVPRCGTEWTNLARSGSNAGHSNFGCAVTANLAAQIADPRDIVGPRPMTGSHPGRRAVVIDKYRLGEQTAAVREVMLENQRVSDAVD